MDEKFRKVKPLYLNEYSDDPHAEVWPDGTHIRVNMESIGWSVDEARALRDWLNKERAAIHRLCS